MQHTAIPNITHSSKGGFSLMAFGIPSRKASLTGPALQSINF